MTVNPYSPSANFTFVAVSSENPGTQSLPEKHLAFQA
jgi:hypothetical protein